jgi:hypothetical protein
MKVECCSVTLVPKYQPTRRHVPEDWRLYQIYRLSRKKEALSEKQAELKPRLYLKYFKRSVNFCASP